MVIRNGSSKNSTSPPYLVKNEQSLIVKEHINDITGSVLINLVTNMTTIFIQIHERTGALWTC